MKELNVWKRLQGNTPLFFKRVIRVLMSLAAVGGALVGAESLVQGFTLSPFLETLSQWFIVGGLIGSAVAKTTIDHPTDDKS